MSSAESLELDRVRAAAYKQGRINMQNVSVDLSLNQCSKKYNDKILFEFKPGNIIFNMQCVALKTNS